MPRPPRAGRRNVNRLQIELEALLEVRRVTAARVILSLHHHVLSEPILGGGSTHLQKLNELQDSASHGMNRTMILLRQALAG